MFRFVSVLFLFCSVALNALAQSAQSAQAAHAAGPLFSYDDGPFGQSTWEGECKNTKALQAPLDIPVSKPDPTLPRIKFVGYGKATPLTTTMTNPHNLKLYTNAKKNSIEIPGLGTYTLDEFHFHRPSEEATNNHRFTMVVHLVHKKEGCEIGDPDCVVVIAILVTEGPARKDTTALWDILFTRIPPPAVTDGTPAVLEGLLPDGYEHAGYYKYPGSLTTPPCTGNVTFFLLKTPVVFSGEQLARYTRRYPMPNARNIQELNGRTIENR